MGATLESSRIVASNAKPASSFRTDIQGLRAIAVGLVLVYHAGAPFLPGGFVGVDVFFVISGFLITGLLLKEGRANGRISLAGFYSRRVRRIIPAATTVLLTVAVLTVAVMPRTRWDDTAWNIIGSAGYFVNWSLAADAVDYLNTDVPPSAVQHFWTLAVEEQFYIIWPILLLAAVWLARSKNRWGRKSRTRIDAKRYTQWAAIGVLAVTVPSFAWSIYYTSANASSAYFVTTTRLWELAIGAVLAICAASLARVPAVAAQILGWAGLTAIVTAGLLYTSATPFPGVAALMPTLGAAAVIIAGMDGRAASGVGVLLSLRPLRWVGDISYSLYLWHWPLIVVGTYLLGGLEFHQGLIIVALSFIPAYLSYRFIELPFQKWEALTESNVKTLQAGFALMLVSFIAAASILLIPKQTDSASFVIPEFTDSTGTAPTPPQGAELLAIDPSTGAAKDTVGPFTPSALRAADDNPKYVQKYCHQAPNKDAVLPCALGDTEAAFTIAIVGDSHAAQWTPALEKLGQDHGWRLEVYTKSSCPLSSANVLLSEVTYESCSRWNTKMLEHLTGPERPDFVILSSSAYRPAGATTFADGLAETWNGLKKAAVPYAVIKDSPKPSGDVAECVSVNPEQLLRCAFTIESSMNNGSIDQIKAAARTGDVLLDINESICPSDPCAPIIGNVLVYRDTNHLTATYARTLVSPLGEALRRFPEIPFRPTS